MNHPEPRGVEPFGPDQDVPALARDRVGRGEGRGVLAGSNVQPDNTYP